MSHRFYKTARWQKRRAAQLRAEPLCRMCAAQRRTTIATIADHVERHMGDEDSFFNGELQSLCKPCHDSAKQTMEKSGRVRGCDVNGVPFGRPDW